MSKVSKGFPGGGVADVQFTNNPGQVQNAQPLPISVKEGVDLRGLGSTPRELPQFEGFSFTEGYEVPLDSPLGRKLLENQYPIERLLPQSSSNTEVQPYTTNPTWLNSNKLKDAFYKGSPYKFTGEKQLFYLVRADKDTAPDREAPQDTETSDKEANPGSSETLIKKGSQGEDVKKLQEELKRQGLYGGAVDGIFGPQTEGAVRAFQQKNGLEVDGIVGPNTRAKLYVPAEVSTGQVVPTAEERESIQQNLASDGVEIFVPKPSGTESVKTDTNTQATDEVKEAIVIDKRLRSPSTDNPGFEAFKRGESSGQLAFPADTTTSEEIFAGNKLRFLSDESFEELQTTSEGGISLKDPSFITDEGVIQYNDLEYDLDNTVDYYFGNDPGTPGSDIPTEIPERWEFIVAPGSISWNKAGEVNTGNPYGVNRKFIYYNNTSMRSLSLGEVALEGFSVGKSVEDIIRNLEKCMEVDRNPNGFMSPYVWKLYGLGKLYGFFLITGVNVDEILRDEVGRATRAIVAIDLLEVPEYQVYDGRDLARSGDLAISNFPVCGDGSTSTNSTANPGSPGQGLGDGTLVSNAPAGVTREIAFSEGFCLNTYRADGTPRACFGNNIINGNTVKMGDTFTEKQCIDNFYTQLNSLYIPGAVNGVGQENWDKLTNGQKAALIDLSWYVGPAWATAGDPWAQQISKEIKAGNLDKVPDLYGKEASRKKRWVELWNGTREVGSVPDAVPTNQCKDFSLKK